MPILTITNFVRLELSRYGVKKKVKISKQKSLYVQTEKQDTINYLETKLAE